ncbi:alpha/beta fold hydrolase [Micromonospora sonneratiae]|uniref:Alpha/beta hydrolase n=1 Tax=Micromonospora sonneratiae TaxID=1184706 RepID=A0ABW3YCV4_9ACTN
MSSSAASSAAPDTIVLIHGLWLTPRSWEHWIDRYMRAGYRVLAPAWPGMEGEVEELRRDPSPIARLDISQVVDHYEQIIYDLEQPPIIMGHSFGGTFVQLLLDRGLGSAGVAIDAAPVKGVLRMPPSTLKATFPVLHNPANRRRAIPLTPEQFHYTFTNTMTPEESQEAYDRYHVPGAGHIVFEAAVTNLNPFTADRVNFTREDRAPLLLIASGDDHLVPPNMTKEDAGHYQQSKAITAYVEFPDRSHFTIGQNGWEQVADFALDWAVNPESVHALPDGRRPG